MKKPPQECIVNFNFPSLVKLTAEAVTKLQEENEGVFIELFENKLKIERGAEITDDT